MTAGVATPTEPSAAAVAQPALWRTIGVAATVLAAYALGAVLPWTLLEPSSVAVFYPPAGITLAALVINPTARWPAILLAAATAEFGLDLLHGQSAPVAAGFTLANVAEPLAGALLFRRFRPAGEDLGRRGTALAFVGCCVIAGPLVGATVGASVGALGQGRGWWSTFGPYWAGDALAVLTLGAAVITVAGRRTPLGSAATWRAVGALAATVALTVIGFWSPRLPMAYLPVPLLLAAAFRARLGLVTAAGFVMAGTANLLTAAGRGPWAGIADSDVRAATLQLYLGATVLGAGALAAAVLERDRARAESRLESAARRRLQALQELTARLSTAATSDEIAALVAANDAGLVGEIAVVVLLDRADGSVRTWTTDGVPAEFAIRFRRLSADEALVSPAGWVARTGTPLTLTDPDELRARFPLVAPAVASTGTRCVVALPLRAGDRLLGAIGFGFTADGEPPPDTLAMAQAVTGLTGQALARAERYEVEHEAARRLQRSLLPDPQRHLPGVDVEVRYRPAERGDEVGGDWYDVFELPGHRVGLAVGDVVGHGLDAATAMGRLQRALRAAALAGGGPAEVLEALDEASRRIPGAEYATVGYAVYSPAEGTLRYACAGHPPPLLVHAGRADFLGEARSLPLTLARRPRTDGVLAVPDGATLIWYSDGLVERRGEVIDDGLRRLAETAVRLPDPAEAGWCDALLAALTEGQQSRDDLVLVRLRLLGAGGLPDDPDVLRRVLTGPGDLVETRSAIRAWAADRGLSAELTENLLLACGEALANSLEHAYQGREPGPVLLRAGRAGRRTVTVDISDHGTWRHRPSATDGRGRGLMLMGAVAQRTVLEIGRQGTRIVLTLDPD
ncbi:SpoIIE family protein phosphatase [Micromonospora auratinigra]|uniref:Serine phosphatase RsbU, regulator of sigma subunit n=1 Tax=Micromonospora auratinigra TaxID=261654 RepID=A0A1A8ZAR7_9ACTN|nr:SpoIIE family protein phosphatase [Micromonospora auratinigra]SBT40926.1 Serine phosphatase RsbU, regulator of sigma subunit [Micromonospora auratinigra]